MTSDQPVRTVPERDTHAMTCDVEDYFQVSAFSDLIERRRWEKLECRIPRNVDKVLAHLDDTGNKATFFTLGWVARHLPDVVRRISDCGHEVASHGMEHIRIWQQEPKEFLEDCTATRKLLEDTCGQVVTGYRAASWSLDDRTPWAHEMLVAGGYRYSSSVYPIRHDHFGVPNASRIPYEVAGGDLIEIPATTVRLLGQNFPAAGGGYFRLYPEWLSTWFVAKAVEQTHSPSVFYFHPWELDPRQPRFERVPLKTRFRHYLNLGKFEGRFSRLLERFRWGRMDGLFT